MSTYFYDEQIRRYILQFIRVFSDISVQSTDQNGNTILKTVPVKYGDPSRLVAHVIRNNSENTALPTPMMSAWIQNISPAPNRRVDPYGTNTKQISERKYNYTSGEYENEAGMSYNITRMSPIPYDMKFQLDIWTSNTSQKLQIWEQIGIWFNPSIVLQHTQNPLDWTSLFEIELTETIWTNRSVPAGSEEEKDICSFVFNVPIFLSPPALVDRRKRVEQIVTSMFEVNGLSDIEINNKLLDPVRSCFPELDQMIITPGDHKVSIGIDSNPNELLLLNSHGVADPSLSWRELISLYGELDENSSVVILKTEDNIESEDGDIYGKIQYHPTKDNILVYTIDQDTLPTTIPISPVDNIIDPTKKYPGNGLPVATVGQSYILTSEDSGPVIVPQNTGTNPWGNLVAKSNDIIYYNGTEWLIIFTAENEEFDQYIELTDGTHLRYTNDGWIYTYLGEYHQGYFRIKLSC